MENASNTPSLRFRGYTDAWGQERLGDLGYAQSGIGFPESEQGGKTGIPFYKVSDMNNTGNETIMTNANNYVTQEQILRRKWKPFNDNPAIIFAKVGAALMLNRKRLSTNSFLVDNNTMAYVIDTNKWDYRFVKVIFDNIYLPSLAQVGALPSFNAEDVENLEIDVPRSRKEGEEIGKFFFEIDSLLTLHQRKLSKLQEINKSLLQNMFPAEGEDRPKIRFAGYTDAWGQERLGDICSITKGSGLSKENLGYEGANKCVLYGHLYTDYGFFIKDVHWGTNVLPDNPIYSEVGDVLVPGSDTTPTGCARAASIDVSGVLLGGDINVFKHSDNIDGDFLSLSINHERPAMISMIKGTSVRHLTGKDLRDLAVKFPKEVKEQRCISSVFIKLDSLLSLHQRKLEKLQQIKKALLEQMFC